jgi:hypothetical protein
VDSSFSYYISPIVFAAFMVITEFRGFRKTVYTALNEVKKKLDNPLSTNPASAIGLHLSNNELFWYSVFSYMTCVEMLPLKIQGAKAEVEAVRLVLNYKNLNAETSSEGWPIPNIRVMIYRIGATHSKYLK